MDEAIDRYLREADPILATVLDRVTLAPLPGGRSVFGDLVGCLIDQQIPHRSRGTWMKKVTRLLDGAAPSPMNVFSIEEEDWNRAKLSNRKYHALRAFAAHWEAARWSELDWHHLPEEKIRTLLRPLPGIGPQTVDMLLLYTLRRPDIFPVGDYHLKPAMAELYDLETKPAAALKHGMLNVAAAWAPYRSYGTRALLAYRKAHSGRKSSSAPTGFDPFSPTNSSSV